MGLAVEAEEDIQDKALNLLTWLLARHVGIMEDMMRQGAASVLETLKGLAQEGEGAGVAAGAG